LTPEMCPYKDKMCSRVVLGSIAIMLI